MCTKLLLEKTEENKTIYLKLMENFPYLTDGNVISYLTDTGYFTAPSSYKYHGNWVGGNFEHSLKVTELLLEFTKTEDLKWDREESPYIIGMFHDLCKSDQKTFKEEDGQIKIIAAKLKDKRHGERSIEMIEHNIISLTDQEKQCIYYHMGEYGGKGSYLVRMKEAAETDPNITYTQLADSAAARMGV